MLAKYDYEKLADHISDDLIKNNVPLHKSIMTISIDMKLNPEQIKRLTESSNIKAYNKMYDNLEDKTFTFDVADSKKVIDEVYSDTDDKTTDVAKKTEIKDMPPVEFKASVNPKKPERTDEVLGDNNEVVISKNTQNSEDAASDTYFDALKIPKKDYSYSEGEVSEESEDESGDESEELLEGSEIEDDEDENDKNKKVKEASVQEVSDLRKHLDNHVLILEDRLVDEITKTASLFRSVNKSEKFAEFVKNAYALHGDNDYFSEAINLIKDAAKIDTSIKVKPGLAKYASKDSMGNKQFTSLLETIDLYKRTKMARELLDK
jgi:hypothetical protein